MDLALNMIDYGNGYKKHKALFNKFYASGLLIPEEHARLVMCLDQVAHQASIPGRFIYQHSMKDFCSATELDWVRTLKARSDDGKIGLVYLSDAPKVDERMFAIAGACIRNYLDARVYTVQKLLSLLKDGDEPSCDVLLCPNFYLNREAGGHLPSWQVSGLLGMLYSRFSKDLATVIYVESMDGLGAEYGDAFKKHLLEHFVCIKE